MSRRSPALLVHLGYLALCVLFWCSLDSTKWASVLHGAGLAERGSVALLQACGPAAFALLALRPMSIATIAICFCISWTLWFVTLFKTRLGEQHWAWHVVVGACWLLAGLPVAGLAVT